MMHRRLCLLSPEAKQVLLLLSLTTVFYSSMIDWGESFAAVVTKCIVSCAKSCETFWLNLIFGPFSFLVCEKPKTSTRQKGPSFSRLTTTHWGKLGKGKKNAATQQHTQHNTSPLFTTSWTWLGRSWRGVVMRERCKNNCCQGPTWTTSSCVVKRC